MCKWAKCHNFDNYKAASFGCGKRENDPCNYQPRNMKDVTEQVVNHWGSDESHHVLSQDKGKELVYGIRKSSHYNPDRF